MHPESLSFQPASSKERVLLQNLAQFYSYDFSEMLEMDVDEDGRFGGVDLTPCWVDEWRHPFLLRIDDKLAGFALISERSKITGRAGVFDMTEFCIGPSGQRSSRRSRRPPTPRRFADQRLITALEPFQGKGVPSRRARTAAAPQASVPAKSAR